MKSNRVLGLSVIWLLIGINLAVFMITLADQSLVYSLGFQPASFLHRPWTILTSLFVHAGVGHIIVNMITLFFFGSYLARLVGERNLLIVYFAGGILGNIFYLFLGPAYSTAVGASGAIFAVGGALAVMTPRLKVLVFPIPVPLPLWIAVIGVFLILSLIPQVAWQAHLGGLILGLIAGYYFKRKGPYLV
jgi:membrane associated rhomboid family serine protease